MTTPNSSNEPPPFWNSQGEQPTPKQQGPGLTTLAEYAPPLLRPFARVLAGALNGGTALSAFSIALLIGLGGIFIVGELAETIRDWGAFEVSRAQARLFNTQRIREEVETEVAQANIRLTVEQEIEAIARREQAIWDSARPLQEGWGDARVTSAYHAMIRYRALFEEAQAEIRRCREQTCAPYESHRWAARAALFDRLFYTAAGFLRKEGIGPDGDSVTVRPETTQVLTYPLNVSGFELEWPAKAPEQSARAQRPNGPR